MTHSPRPAAPICAPRILVIDSGVGGLSVCAALVDRLPDCEIRLVADNAAYPYGSKSTAELQARIFKIHEAHAAAFDPHLIVIACNTATLAAIGAARAQLHNPALLDFIGTEPAIRPATRRTLSGTVGLLATQATVDSPALHQRLAAAEPSIRIITKAAPKFVSLAEAKMRGAAVDLPALAAELQHCFSREELAQMDTCILGCTHFPLLKPELKHIAPAMNWIDTGEDISRRACTLLGRIGIYPPGLTEVETPAHQMIFTAPDAALRVSAQRLAALGLGSMV